MFEGRFQVPFMSMNRTLNFNKSFKNKISVIWWSVCQELLRTKVGTFCFS
jgi:hypothetical protein